MSPFSSRLTSGRYKTQIAAAEDPTTGGAGRDILIRFEYVTDQGFNLRGALLDDIAIPEIGFLDEALAGIIKDLEVHKRFSLDVDGIHICDYESDFVYRRNGSIVVETAARIFSDGVARSRSMRWLIPTIIMARWWSTCG